MADKTPYEVLGLTEDCSFDDIRHHYRMLAKKFHPDMNKTDGAKEMFDSVRASYDFLMANHIESVGVQAAKTIEEMIFAHKMAKAAANKKAQPRPKTPPGKKLKRGVKEESLVDALKRWSTT